MNNNTIEETVIKTLKDFSMLRRKDSLILGVSGGPDSICLLRLFHKLKNDYKLNFVCAHFNHGLRAGESDSESDFVRALCKELKVKCLSSKRNVAKLYDGDSLEQTARRARYDFFETVSRETKIKKVALAHHKDDLAETVLMRIIRGSGLRGVRGFLPNVKIGRINIIRPLINVTKQDILNWLKINDYEYKHDSSNDEDIFFRNNVRNKLIPSIREFNPNITDSLCNLAIHAGMDYDFIFQSAREAFNYTKISATKQSITLSLSKLKKMHTSLICNVIRYAVEELKGNVNRLETRHLQEVTDLINNRPVNSVVNLPFLRVIKEQHSILIQFLIL
ncbi:MAG: tRNA lysidine(34) synthetase TilS [Candidatus Omnitrophica bacterium]|nr:tRNA lysidine(34) synthetase TilS [Candidatus Omnitrophota bacterium]MDD5081141.1 tRNA lysidine(34) synthetase TilS [Candidatus Omnitrophota bacterium]MDD5441006.1 tRNA lysidine(34) synthetase TilS [Candidatus Omnitrophota bacterium]